MTRLNEIEESFEVPASLSGERVDRALSMLTGWSRAEAVAIIEAGAVLVDGQHVNKSRRLVTAETVKVTAEPAPERPPEPEDLPLDLRHVDDDLIVLVKPAGVVVHPGAGRESHTLVAGLLARFPHLASVGDPMRPGIVHRLDRDTSGLMAVAASQRGYEALVDAFTRRIVTRRYLALCWGHLDARRGLIDAPIGRSSTRRTRMAVSEAGKEARTSYEVLDVYTDPVVTMLECRLETGRTHQIRVHLSAIGHAVVGDSVYGGNRQPLTLHRPFLHARSLEIPHPVSGELLSFDDPLPEELEVVRARLTR